MTPMMIVIIKAPAWLAPSIKIGMLCTMPAILQKMMVFQPNDVALKKGVRFSFFKTNNHSV